MAKPFLSIIIPAYNEAKRLPLTLIDVDRHLAAQEYSYEILVVDDGSTDNTGEMVRKFMAVVKNLKLLNNPEHRGKGAAARVGMLSAHGNWRLILGADNAISILEFNNMLTFLKLPPACDIFSASRSVRGTKLDPPRPLTRRAAEFFLNKFIKTLFKSKITDFLMDFQCFSEAAAEKVFINIKMERWSTTFEALLLGEKFGLRVQEIPVRASYNAVGKSHFRIVNYLQLFWETLKIWWWLKRDRYKLT